MLAVELGCKIIPPEGWITEKDELHDDYFWGDNDSDGQRMAKALGLKSPSRSCAKPESPAT